MSAEFPFRFRCRRSGNCCARPGGFVRVTEADVEAIARAESMSPAAVRSRYVDGDILKSGLGNRCVFLVDGAMAECSIYAARPEKCRTWPYWPELVEDPVLLAEAMRVCPGIEASAS